MTQTQPRTPSTFNYDDLMPYQHAAVNHIATRPSSGLFLGMSAGKSLITLAAFQKVRPKGHILVIAPLAIARSVWIEEIEKWGFNVRTKSLIVDDNDRQFSLPKRLERFQEVFEDPPTMYFINKEMLTQSSHRTNKLVIDPNAAYSPPTLSQTAQHLLDLLKQGPLPKDELISAAQDHLAQQQPKPPTKKSLNAGIKELRDASIVETRGFDCESCSGKGCRSCRYGLIDQMPTEKVDGRTRTIWPFSTIVIDESQGFASFTAERTKALRRIRAATDHVIELSGTPTPDGPINLFSQVWLLDQGQTLGNSLTAYRSKYFRPTIHIDGRPVKWEIIPGAEKEIYSKIGHLVMSAENTEIPLPEVTPRDQRDMTVKLSKDAMRAYQQLEQDLVIEILNEHSGKISEITAESAGVLHNKLLQIASGTLYTGDNHDTDYEVIHTEKIEMTDYLLHQAGGSPVIVAYRYRSDKSQLLHHLRKRGHQVEVFDKSRAMVQRWNAGEIDVMLLQPASAGHGLNLQYGGHQIIWYSLPDSMEHYQQLNSRLARIGQQHPVELIQLISAGTRDIGQPGRVYRKTDSQQTLLDSVRADITAYIPSIEDEIGDLDISPL